MPELPEVETICRGLENNIIGKKIASVFISDKKLRLPFPHNFSIDLKEKTLHYNLLTMLTFSFRNYFNWIRSCTNIIGAN